MCGQLLPGFLCHLKQHSQCKRHRGTEAVSVKSASGLVGTSRPACLVLPPCLACLPVSSPVSDHEPRLYGEPGHLSLAMYP